jgi:predicted alpha/beta hydrolase family esterase
MKRVISVHGWAGHPDEGWRPWLGEILAKHGIEFISPLMPNTRFPQESEWTAFLRSIVGRPDTDTFLIGHSLGVISILRYLETLQKDEEVGGVVFVAGFTDDLGIPELTNFFSLPINWSAIRPHVQKVVSFESDNDPYGLARYNDDFQHNLNAETFLLHDRKHFSGDDGIVELPEAKNVLLKMLRI